MASIFTHTKRFGPTDEEYTCHYCSAKCDTYIMYDRFSNENNEYKGRITFCNSECLNETTRQYLRYSFFKGYLCYTSQTFKKNDNDKPKYRCIECCKRCSNVFALTQININDEEETLAFCNDHCHTKFSTKYFNYSFEIGHINTNTLT
jgi:hypothetical protein